MTHRQRLSTILIALITALGLAAAAPGAATAAPATQAAAGVVNIPITGSTEDAGTFAGTFTPQSFAARDGGLIATGILTGTLTDASGDTVGTVTEPVSVPVAVAQATCRILDLTLGPLHLDL